VQLVFKEIWLQLCVCVREKDVLIRGPRVCVRENVCMRMCVWVCVMSMCVWVCVNEYVCERKMFSFEGHAHISRVCVYEYVCMSMCV